MNAHYFSTWLFVIFAFCFGFTIGAIGLAITHKPPPEPPAVSKPKRLIWEK